MKFESLQLNTDKKIYFASDFHLGAPDGIESLDREKRIITWLDEVSKDAQYLFLLGDIFDFWFEYKHVAPKGYVRLLGKIAELSDKGIDIRFFMGNHDLWTFGYLETELNVKIYKKPQLFKIQDKLCFVGHGDGLGPGDHGYKFIKKVFSFRFSQILFAFLHPRIGIGLARFFSRKSRAKTGMNDAIFKSENDEMLVHFCKETLKAEPDIDYFIFGHRHLPLDIRLTDRATYINTGDWLRYDSYAVFENNQLHLVNPKK